MAKKEKEVLGFMTFALFAGAGNIIFPPFIVAAGGDLWKTASGFFLLPIGPQFR